MADPSFDSVGADEPELDLYTIPGHSSWFLWDEIHENEKSALNEFFDGNSISRTPRIYKEYRDFIINKYREDPSMKLTFTEVRKSLVGDVNTLHKVFLFLEKWGLINYGAPLSAESSMVMESGEAARIRIDDGVPNGVRVGAMPSSVKPIAAPPGIEDNSVVLENGFKLPLLASYSDVFGDLMNQNKLNCGNCGQECNLSYYKYTKSDFFICINCYTNGKYGEEKSVDDFKLHEYVENENSGSHGAVWTEEEILFLLESVLKHGDDWELVAQEVQTKTKLECILKLIELPLGEFMLPSACREDGNNFIDSNLSSVKENELISSTDQETLKKENQFQNGVGDALNQGPSKRRRMTSISEAGGSLMKQVASISTMVGPSVMAAAADAAVTTICDENFCSREIFEGQDYSVANGVISSSTNCDTERFVVSRDVSLEDSEMRQSSTPADGASLNKDCIPLILRIRAAIATALGVAAARAKILAEQEEREMEHLVATIIETQMKKLNSKMKHFEELKPIMEKELEGMEEMVDSLLTKQIDAHQTMLNLRISSSKDHSSVKSQE